MDSRSLTQIPCWRDWHFWIGIIQTIALIAAVAVALNIGIQQNDLVAEQNSINNKIFEMNEKLMNLTLQPSVHIIFEPKSEKLQLMNFGKGNLWVKTVQVGSDNPVPMGDGKMLMVPTAPYVPTKPDVEFPIKKLKQKTFKEIGQNGLRRIPFIFKIENFDGEDYVFDVTVNFIAKDGVKSVVVQPSGFTLVSKIISSE